MLTREFPHHEVRPLGGLLRLSRWVPDRLALRAVHIAGDPTLLLRPCVGVIGSRTASPGGIRRAFDLAEALARAGVVVVSGLARGIDAAAHRGALAAGGTTIAVLGTGLDRAYPPEHRELQAELACDHLVVSPFPAGVGPHRSGFPQRNRLMAALTDATIVIEAGPQSGTRHQVEACLHSDLARTVLLHASLVDPPLPWVEPLLGCPSVRVFASPAEALAVLRGPSPGPLPGGTLQAREGRGRKLR